MIKAVLLAAAPAQPPREFRVFRANSNPSTKGTFLFGPAEASAVMAAWRAEGSHRLPIDVEHDSLDPAARAARADAGDAVGWFTPELRNGGELWATQVEFGAAGLERLAKKSQTYFSPAFNADGDGKIQALINVALVSMPALHALDQLVAASKLGRANSTMLGARVERVTATKFRSVAAKCNLTPGALLRTYIKLAAKSPSTSPEETLAGIADLLGLPADAAPDVIRAAVDSVFAEANKPTPSKPTPAPIDPNAAAADAPPEHLSRGIAQRAARAASDPLRAVQAARRDAARRR